MIRLQALKREGCGAQRSIYVALNYSTFVWHNVETRARRGGDEVENPGTDFNEKTNVRIRWLLITDTKQAASWIDVSLCFPVNNICLLNFCCTMWVNTIKKESSSRALTFAVIGRGEVGEFPQQPSFLSVPAETENTVSETQPASLVSTLWIKSSITVMLKFLNDMFPVVIRFWHF